MTDTVPVRFEVLIFEPVHGAGRLVGLASVRLDLGDLELTLQGVGVIRDHAGKLSVRAPVWRHPGSGKWLPAVLLPPELSAAIGAELLRMMKGEGS